MPKNHGLTPQQARAREYLAHGYFGGQAYMKTIRIGSVSHRVVAGIKYFRPLYDYKLKRRD